MSGIAPALAFIDGLDASLIVPGHGEPMRDHTLRRAAIGVFRELSTQGIAARARGFDPDAARAEIMPSLRPLMLLQITGDIPAANNAFEIPALCLCVLLWLD